MFWAAEGPPLMPGGYNPNLQIFQGEHEVLIRHEMMGDARIIRTDGSGHIDSRIRQYHGDSIGHWEGDVLVVDTARFAKHGIGNAQKLPSGPDKRLTERFQLSQDKTRIFYSFELTDPTYLAAPVSYKFEWVYSPDFEMVQLPCDQESAKRYLQLQ